MQISPSVLNSDLSDLAAEVLRLTQVNAELTAANAALMVRVETARDVVDRLDCNLRASLCELCLWSIEDSGEIYNGPDANMALDAARGWLAGGAE